MHRFSDPARLGSGHVLSGFDCGRESLNLWLERYARTAGISGSARAYVVDDHEQLRVVGYHALTVASIEHSEATERATIGMPRHQIPAVLLARLAVDETVQGMGIGAFLLADAMRRALAVGEEAGVRLVLVHAIDGGARAFYERFGFEPSPTDPMNLQMIMKDVRASLDAAAGSAPLI